MAIKVSTLLKRNTVLSSDSSPTLSAILNTNNFAISNGANPVTISVNSYPTTSGSVGQVLSTDGAGTLSWADQTGGAATITLMGDVTGSGLSPITTIISPTGVVANTYGSTSSVGMFAVNAKGQITSAANAPISITPSAAGLGNVTNLLQVVNAGGTPSITDSVGAPVSAAATGAIYIDQTVTNGNSIYRYTGASWSVIATKSNLYNEKSSGFTPPAAQGTNSVAIGSGSQTASSAIESLAIGSQSLARIQGGVVQANGRFGTSGDAQTGRYLLRSHTINAASTELFIDGTAGSVRLTLPDDATWTFKITVTAHRTDNGNGHAGYTAVGVIYRGAGVSTTYIQGSVQKSVIAESNPAWDINISADKTYGSLKVMVTGESSKTIRWLALIETVEVTN